jgi:hypothetical protein
LRLRGTNYDKFLVSQTPVTLVQFWGLLIIGGSLVLFGLLPLALILGDLVDVPNPGKLVSLPRSPIIALSDSPWFSGEISL